MSGRNINFKVDLGDIQARMDRAHGFLAGPGKGELFRSLAQTLEAETEANFAAQGRPSWVPHSAATKAARMKRNRGSSILQILQDSGILASSISSYFDDDSVVIGAGGAAKAYAAIHQYGGDVNIPARQQTLRLRTDAGGTLMRQGKSGAGKNLAVFAKQDGPRAHKRFSERSVEVPAHTVHIPSRPYLPFAGPPGAETLQPSAQDSILAALERGLRLAFG